MSIFTIEYSQPSEYRFSQDSVEAPLAVAEWASVHLIESSPTSPAPTAAAASSGSIHKGVSVTRVLDLCAGSGVMGLEFAFHFPRSVAIDFVEVQSVYREHFATNAGRMQLAKQARGERLEVQWIERNYETLLAPEYRDRYPLVMANPPYFRIAQGMLSPSEFKNRCRFFMDSTPEAFWDVCVHVLKPGGSAFILSRPLDDHGFDVLEEISRRLRYSATVEKWRDIRGTDLLKITKMRSD